MHKSDTYNPIVDKSFDFALEIIELADHLEENRKYVLSRQIYKSGTSIGANVKEAQGAESRADFIHKMKVALKEAEETEYWLMLANRSRKYPNTESYLIKLKEIQKILNVIVSTSKRGLKEIKTIPKN